MPVVFEYSGGVPEVPFSTRTRASGSAPPDGAAHLGYSEVLTGLTALQRHVTGRVPLGFKSGSSFAFCALECSSLWLLRLPSTAEPALRAEMRACASHCARAAAVYASLLVLRSPNL